MESNFRSLKCFMIAAEEMNFTRAARRLYITQQSLSKHIRRLEEQYEVQLFDRQPTLRLTMAGEQLLKYARKMLREENKLFNDLHSETSEGQVRLSVGLPTSRSAPYLSEVIQAYHALRPNVVTSCQVYSYAAVNAALRAGDIDLYFSTLGAAGKYGRRLSVVKDELYFVLSEGLLKRTLPESWRGFLDSARSGVRLAETVEFPVALPPHDTVQRNILDSHYAAASHAPNVLTELNDGSARLELCAGDFCAAILPKSQLFREHFSMETPIYALHITDLDELTRLGIIYSEQEGVPQYVTDYIDCAREVIADADARLNALLASRMRETQILPLNYTG